MTEVSAWSSTDASNNSVSPNGWKSGTMLPSETEPVGRMMMGALRRWFGLTAFAAEGRLTLTSGTPVMTTGVSDATTIYFTPYGGALVPIYNGTDWAMTQFAELSNVTTDATKNPAAVAVSSVYDLFVWSDSGTLRLSRGPAWTNTTTRSAGTALVYQNGIPLNSIAITNGPGASRGTYVGTVASNGTSKIDFTLGGVAGGPRMMVWNYWNRRWTGTSVTDNSAGYTYTSSTIRQANALTGNQIAFLCGASVSNVPEESFVATYAQCFANVAVATATAFAGIGLDSTTTFYKTALKFNSGAAATSVFGAGLAYTIPATLGVHTISANERGDSANANTFNSDFNAGTLTFGMMM